MNAETQQINFRVGTRITEATQLGTFLNKNVAMRRAAPGAQTYTGTIEFDKTIGSYFLRTSVPGPTNGNRGVWLPVLSPTEKDAILVVEINE